MKYGRLGTRPGKDWSPRVARFFDVHDVHDFLRAPAIGEREARELELGNASRALLPRNASR